MLFLPNASEFSLKITTINLKDMNSKAIREKKSM